MWHIYVLSNRLTDQNNEIAVKSYLFFSGALIRKNTVYELPNFVFAGQKVPNVAYICVLFTFK